MAPISLRFTQQQTEYFKAKARETGLAMTEIIRRAADEYRDRYPVKKAA
jgi:hypothetical protein